MTCSLCILLSGIYHFHPFQSLTHQQIYIFKIFKICLSILFFCIFLHFFTQTFASFCLLYFWSSTLFCLFVLRVKHIYLNKVCVFFFVFVCYIKCQSFVVFFFRKTKKCIKLNKILKFKFFYIFLKKKTKMFSFTDLFWNYSDW